jgi:hypothetical protein
VQPGPVDVLVQTSGKPPKQQSITVAAGERRDMSLDAGSAAANTGDQPAEASKGPSKPINGMLIGGIAASAVGAVGLGMFIAEGASSSSTYSDLNKKCPSGQCSASVRSGLQNEVQSGISAQTVANVGLVLGVVGAGAGVTLIVLSRRGSSSSTAPTTGSTTHLVVGPSYTGLAGTF